MRGQRGIPKLYHVKYRDRSGASKETSTWYADVWKNGKRDRVSLKTANKTEATQKLKEILADHVSVPKGLRKLSDILALVTADHEREQYAASRHLPSRLAHIHRLMGDPTIGDVDTAAMKGYQNLRLKEGASRGTIELEVCTIGRGFSIARELGMLRWVPKVPHLRIDNARQGFYLRADFERIVGHLPWHWQPFAWTAYHTGWRPKEILSRQWRHVDLERGWMRLEPTEAKNKHGRETPMVPELLAILKLHREACTALERKVERVIPWVNFSPRFYGRRLVVYADVWMKARNKAGLSGRLLYDCRRTRVRNLERAGVSRTAGREWVGHRDPRIYQRYAISDELMLTEARDKAAAFEEQLRAEMPTVVRFAEAKK